MEWPRDVVTTAQLVVAVVLVGVVCVGVVTGGFIAALRNRKGR